MAQVRFDESQQQRRERRSKIKEWAGWLQNQSQELNKDARARPKGLVGAGGGGAAAYAAVTKGAAGKAGAGKGKK